MLADGSLFVRTGGVVGGWDIVTIGLGCGEGTHDGML